MSNDVHQKDGHGPSQNTSVSYSWVLWIVAVIVTIMIVANNYVRIIAAWQFIMHHRSLVIGLLVLLSAGFIPAWVKWNNGRVRRHKLDEMHVPHRRLKRSRT